ncbi:hypothetical protein E3226_005215 [Legionella geestiana]|uniref:hypothetical protein n=1 Tax=Legionella geestiana TaxID=45065 RepID=UPI0010925E3E|nr:hypothetical protein [Legionella geestiana]QDQ39835.1 hypothetical protein E3226_005215 [Legionella geestiana]
MSKLLRDNDETMIALRLQFRQSGWFSRLFFPSDMQRYLLQFYIPLMPWAASSSSYEAQYRAEAAFRFCTQYQDFITDNSLFGRFRRWLLDYLPAFNTSRLMEKWRFTQEHQLREEEFEILVANEDACAEAFQREILVFKRALANDDSLQLRGVYAQYLRDISIRSPLPSAQEGFAALLITSRQKGIAYEKSDSSYGESYKARQHMFRLFNEDAPDFAGIIASLQRLNTDIPTANLATVEQVIMLFKSDRLDKWVNGLNALHAQTMNPETNRSALHENPRLIKLLLNHSNPEHLSQGLVTLLRLGLCVKTSLLKDGEAKIDVFDKFRIQQRALESTTSTLMSLPEFYLKGVTTEAGVGRVFGKHFADATKRSEQALQDNKKFDARFNRFSKLKSKHHLPKTVEMSDFETSGLNVLRLAHHPYPERVASVLGKLRMRMADSFIEERACVVGSANGWGFALGDRSIAFFNYVQSKGLNVIYHLLLDLAQIFLHDDVLPYWEGIQDNQLSPVDFVNIYRLCIHALDEDSTPAGAALARGKVAEYLQNISSKNNSHSVITETALTLMLIHGGKMLDEKLLDGQLRSLTASILLDSKNNENKTLDCIKRLQSEGFVDSETGISATQLLALTWIALQKACAKERLRSLRPSVIMGLQLDAFQEAFSATHFAKSQPSSSSEVSMTMTISPSGS